MDNPFDPRTIDFDYPCRIWLSRQRVTIVSAEDSDFAADLWQFHRDQRGRPYVYRQIAANGHRLGLYLHRAIMLRVSPPPSPKHVVDHISGNSLDNRRSNLRWASQSENRNNGALFGNLEEMDWLEAVRSNGDFMTVASTIVMKPWTVTAPRAKSPSSRRRRASAGNQTVSAEASDCADAT